MKLIPLLTMNSKQSEERSLKYHRVGYADRGTKSDKLLALFLSAIPGDNRLPLHWHFRSHENFLKRHGHLGNILWAASFYSHLLMVNGFFALRIWTDVDNTCWVDIADNVAGHLDPTWIEPIPEKNFKKSRPFTKRVKVSQQFQMLTLANAVKKTYGIYL